MRRILSIGFCFILVLLTFGLLSAPASAMEKMDRGLIALEREDGSVYLGWRKLKEDDPQTVYEITVNLPDSSESWRKTTRSSNCIFEIPKQGSQYTFQLTILFPDSKRVNAGTVSIDVTGKPRSYVSIPFKGDYQAKRVGIGDLDGDGAYEYVIQQPNFNTDPYQQPGYWKKSPTTYKLEAYEPDGTMLWRYDMGWSIEAGSWYAPYVVYDVDGDGKAEVYCKAGEGDPRDEKGLVQSGPEYLVKLDGETGKIVAKTDWLSREGYRDYNLSCRNFLAVAYLSGRDPSLIVQRGTYRLIKTIAMDKDFKKIWYWEATGEYEKYRGQGSHGLISADVDHDGRDELVIGAAVIDDNGKGLWTLGMGHPDVCYVTDIDSDNPGLEIFYGFETRQDTDGICVVDAKTGKKLWTHKEPTRHIHSQGMIGDLLAEYPGVEVFAGERDTPDRWLYSAKGELIEKVEGGSLTPRAVWWDADAQKEVAQKGAIRDWNGEAIQPIKGSVIGVADCLGDAREELITSADGELRIYTTAIPSSENVPCLMQDRQYRLGVAAQTMGYFYPAQLGETQP